MRQIQHGNILWDVEDSLLVEEEDERNKKLSDTIIQEVGGKVLPHNIFRSVF